MGKSSPKEAVKMASNGPLTMRVTSTLPRAPRQYLTGALQSGALGLAGHHSTWKQVKRLIVEINAARSEYCTLKLLTPNRDASRKTSKRA